MSRTMTKSPGQNDSFDFSQEGNLYAVDSLNNLNKLNLCIDESQDLIHEDSTDEMPWSTMRGQCIFLLTLIIIAAVTCILILCIVGFFVQAKKDTDDMLTRLTSGGKEIEELLSINHLIFKHLKKNGP
ncbi:leucine-rich single-pass membrane protein 1 isoform X1 [Lissotriton helveticus]